MATGGVDGHIVVYDAETFRKAIIMTDFCMTYPKQSPAETIKKIQFHEGMIKGLAFDPAGEFLASQVLA